MDITISVSEKTAELIQHKADENGKDIIEFATNLFEAKIAEEFPEVSKNDIEEDYESPFAPFIGMFSSGKTDTSERMNEILYSEDFNPAEGFGIKR